MLREKRLVKITLADDSCNPWISCQDPEKTNPWPRLSHGEAVKVSADARLKGQRPSCLNRAHDSRHSPSTVTVGVVTIMIHCDQGNSAPVVSSAAGVFIFATNTPRCFWTLTSRITEGEYQA
jgi:hypothetical protein